MDLAAATWTALGVSLVAFGFADVFLTIFHPDREGPIARVVARGIWRGAITLATWWRRGAREIVALAGPVMMLATLAAWVLMIITGFALWILPELPTQYHVAGQLRPLAFLDALYYAGVAFTTLGFGDITPVGGTAQSLSFLLAASGFGLITSALAYVLNVYAGMEHRDLLTLRLLAETDDTCDGVQLVLDSLRDEDEHALAMRLESWAGDIRALEEKLYRFQNISFYLRSRPRTHDPEPMLDGVSGMALAALLLAEGAPSPRVRPSARHLASSYGHFMLAVGRRLVRGDARGELDNPPFTDEDGRRVRETWEKLAEVCELPEQPPTPEQAPRAWRLAARSRVFLDEVDRVTRWRALRHERT